MPSPAGAAERHGHGARPLAIPRGQPAARTLPAQDGGRRATPIGVVAGIPRLQAGEDVKGAE